MTKTSSSEKLEESCAGFYQAENHAKMIWQGNKDLIVLGVDFKDSIGKSFYLVSGNNCYGVVRLKGNKQISMKEFDALAERHRVTDSEKKLWWSGKKVLYAYDFDFTKFEDFKRVAIPDKVETFVDRVEFLKEDDRKEMPISEFLKLAGQNIAIKSETPISQVLQEGFDNYVLQLTKLAPAPKEVKLFEATNSMEAEKSFSNEDELVEYLFGGG